jgi:hypothetical protein
MKQLPERPLGTQAASPCSDHIEREYSDQLMLRLLERLETGTWRQKQQVEHSGSVTFKTRAERLSALEAARRADCWTVGTEQKICYSLSCPALLDRPVTGRLTWSRQRDSTPREEAPYQ